jgi:hypothetical protein
LANFKAHLLGAATAGGVGAAAAFALFGVRAFPLAGAALVAGVVGGLLPDLDHDHAVPVRELFSLLAAVLPAAALPALLSRGLPPEWGVAVFAATYVVIRFGAAPLFKRFTVHRGIFHSLPFLLASGLLAALALRALPPGERLFLGGVVSLGALVHLVLDEVWAVDFNGRRLKKSFGTALKLWAPSRPATIACYVALLALALLAWRDLT